MINIWTDNSRQKVNVMVRQAYLEGKLPRRSFYFKKNGILVRTVDQTTGTQTLQLANWLARFLAWLIDVAILSVTVGIIQFFTLPGFNYAGLPSWVPFVSFGPSSAVYFLYWTFMESVYGRSIGKMIMRLRVVRVTGQPIDLGSAALESVGKAFLLPIDLIVGWIVSTRKRQRLFNYLSRTVVIMD